MANLVKKIIVKETMTKISDSLTDGIEIILFSNKSNSVLFFAVNHGDAEPSDLEIGDRIIERRRIYGVKSGDTEDIYIYASGGDVTIGVRA